MEQEMKIPNNEVDGVRDDNATKVVTSAPEMVAGKTGAKKGMIVGMVCLAVAAVVGCAFGTYAMVSRDSEIAKVREECASASANNDGAGTETTVVTCPDGNEVEVKTEKVIDNKLAANIVNPYLTPLAYPVNIFDVDFDSTTKFGIAFSNLDPNDVNRRDGEQVERVSYSEVDAEYRYLFGEELSKADYRTRCAVYEYDASMNMFSETLYGCGGAGVGMINVIKNSYYDDNNVIIEMYHDTMPMCIIDTDDLEEGDYCMPGEYNSRWINPEKAEEIADFITKYADTIPVYKMVFTPNAGHYVLSDVQKQ